MPSKFGGFLVLFVISITSSFVRAEVPGGLIHTAETLPPNTYELVLSPEVTFSPGGVYLSSELRYQPNEDIGVGFGFGSGQVGYNFGVHGIWHLLPDMVSQPAVAVLGGLYFNRLSSENFFVVKLTPTVSKTFKITWGQVVPYGGLQLSPSFGLGGGGNQFALKASMGTQLVVSAFSGVRVWGEFGLGIANSMHEIALGLSYPFNALGS